MSYMDEIDYNTRYDIYYCLEGEINKLSNRFLCESDARKHANKLSEQNLLPIWIVKSELIEVWGDTDEEFEKKIYETL